MLLHHPVIAVAVGWLAVIAVVLQFDSGAILLAVMPTLAVVLNHYLAKRQREAIRRETSKASEASAAKVEEVHGLVNSQKDELERELRSRDEKIGSLETRLAELGKATRGR